MTICFEGASAVGKTTLCSALSDNCTIIPEVNVLFQNEKRSSKFWYYEKQIERYQMSQASRLNTIFDGDIFQPLWYNWIYHYPDTFPTKEETFLFYQTHLIKRQIAFPDVYIVFYVEEEQLRTRKEQDTNRTRRNFEKHLKLITPQKQYFRFLKENTSLNVAFIPNNALNETIETINEYCSKIRLKKRDDISNFEIITSFFLSLAVFILLSNVQIITHPSIHPYGQGYGQVTGRLSTFCLWSFVPIFR